MSLRPGTRTEVRKKSYKIGVDADEARRRREDNLVEIRKNKREDNLLKKRREGLLLQSQHVIDATQSPAAIEKRLECIPLMVQGVWSEDPSAQIEATTQFRKLLSIERSPPIDEVIKAGVVPRFVQFLERNDLPQLQFEAAWALTNVASGTSEHTRVVIDQGAVPKFIQLLSSPSDDVREQIHSHSIAVSRPSNRVQRDVWVFLLRFGGFEGLLRNRRCTVVDHQHEQVPTVVRWGPSVIAMEAETLGAASLIFSPGEAPFRRRPGGRSTGESRLRNRRSGRRDRASTGRTGN
nr:importin subunit alpha-4 [Ipomoea batatas]